MKKTILHSTALATALIVGVIVSGCILSGQFVLVMTGTSTIQSTDDTLDYLHVDLTTNETWEEHQDDIQGIVDIKFECRFENNLASPADGELWISTELYGTVEQVRDNATRVFGGLNLGANEDRDVSFSESADYIENLDVVLDLLESGQFYVYGIAADVPFDVTVRGVGSEDYARFMITFTAGK